MNSSIPKVLLTVLNKPMIDWVLDSCKKSKIKNNLKFTYIKI